MNSPMVETGSLPIALSCDMELLMQSCAKHAVIGAAGLNVVEGVRIRL